MHERIARSIGVKTKALSPLISELKNAKKPNNINEIAIKSSLILSFESTKTRAINTTVPIVSAQVINVSLGINESAGIEKKDKPNKNTEATLHKATKIVSESVNDLILLNINFKIFILHQTYRFSFLYKINDYTSTNHNHRAYSPQWIKVRNTCNNTKDDSDHYK